MGPLPPPPPPPPTRLPSKEQPRYSLVLATVNHPTPLLLPARELASYLHPRKFVNAASPAPPPRLHRIWLRPLRFVLPLRLRSTSSADASRWLPASYTSRRTLSWVTCCCT